jgi:uncharacterized paraquat-inducible protein A
MKNRFSPLKLEQLKEQYKTKTLKQLAHENGVTMRIMQYALGVKDDSNARKCFLCGGGIPGRRVSSTCSKCYNTLYKRRKRRVAKETIEELREGVK